MKRAGMVDIETLSSQSDAAVIAIGLCLFDEKEIIDSTEILIDPVLAPGHRDPDTYRWWCEQDSQVFNRMLSGDLPPWNACGAMAQVIEEWNPKTLWANPPSFDIIILRNLFRVYNIEFPIHYTKERDFRTMKAFAKQMGIDYSAPYDERTAHDAESDAICQAKALQIILRDLALL